MSARPHPLRFAWSTLQAFRANQGPLLAGAVAYYALLSLVPMLILMVIALAHVVDEASLFDTLGMYLNWLVPGQADTVLEALRQFLLHRDVVGWLLLVTMLFFSSLAFGVLENAMSIIFHHRVRARRRSALASALMPYGFLLCLGLGVLLITTMAGQLQALGEHDLRLGGRLWSLEPVSVVLLYALGVCGELLALTAIYLVMPVGRLTPAHALLGAVVATVLWEISRHALLWYFATLSQIGTVYGPLTTAIAALFSLEIGGLLLLFGAQVIAEYERLGLSGGTPPARLNLSRDL